MSAVTLLLTLKANIMPAFKHFRKKMILPVMSIDWAEIEKAKEGEGEWKVSQSMKLFHELFHARGRIAVEGRGLLLEFLKTVWTYPHYLGSLLNHAPRLVC
ncbi:MAG: hypothetical protein U5R49_04445 [Deltaproteobacteria bacterium]|nr:hypothetical protein [Deltaproteobacteria bacterium]